MDKKRTPVSQAFLILISSIVLLGSAVLRLINHSSWLSQAMTRDVPTISRSSNQNRLTDASGRPMFIKRPVHERGLDPASVTPQPDNEVVFFDYAEKEIWRESLEHEADDQGEERPSWGRISDGKARLSLNENPESVYKLKIQFETSIILSGSNEHTGTLEDYKHGQSPWMDLPQNESGDIFISFDEKAVPAMAINADEVQKEIEALEYKAGGEKFGDPRWGLSTVRIKIFKQISGRWTETRQVDFDARPGC